MKADQDYQLKTKPNLSKRILAAAVDYGIIGLYTALIFYLYGEPNGDNGYSVHGWPGFSILFVWFFITVGLEQITGLTLGNRSQQLQAVPKNAPRKSLTFSQSLKRHLLDPIDMWPFGLLGILTIKNTEKNQRLGDLWAKTMVVDFPISK